jgi:caffeoyl-CoA O-methyltransferase
VSDEYTQVARRYWREAHVDHKIDLRLGPALETLAGLLDEGQAGTFDFAFIDADKVNYPHYFEFCLKLLRPGGVVAIDNVLQDGAVLDPANRSPTVEAIRSFNEALYRDRRVRISMLPVADGVTLALKL